MFSDRRLARSGSTRQSSMSRDPDFLPFTPLQKPSLSAMRDNFLANYPRAAYREDRLVLPGLPTIAPQINLIMDPALVEEMLVTRPEAFARDRLTVKALSGPLNRESLLFAEGADWKWQRRAVSAAFRYESLLAQVETFAACARKQSALWSRLERGTPVHAAAVPPTRG